MASTSTAVVAASSSHAAAVPIKKYDVFISFRGEDTRDNFTSHLHAALLRHKIETYIDYKLEKGDEVWPALVQAIHDSSVFLVIFSKNYASSTWCLNELVEIMECKKKSEDVVPVFYRIEPSHVRKQTGSYQTSLDKHEQNLRDGNKTQKWKETLFEAANLAGFDFAVYRTEHDLVEDIIKSVLQKLNHKYSTELRGHFIFDQNYAKIKCSLKIESRELRIIGMWGMGGIGKTTIVEAIFHELSSQYESTCFFANVSEQSKRHGVNYVCSRLLFELLGEDFYIDTPRVIPSIIMNRLRRKKVLIVLDDVSSSEIIKKLVGVRRDCLGVGSKVIVTTRDRHVLVSGGADEIHEVEGMNFQNSIELFTLNAFENTYPKKGYEELSNRAVDYAKGIPLALTILGSFLHSKSEKEWESALMKLKKYPNPEIQGVLRLSYNELDDLEKKIFLDIACFFKGKSRDTLSKVLNACGFFADIGIRSLLDKALITIDSTNCIKMHDFIQDMGHEIVRCESNNPGQRSRLWDEEEVCDVLTSNGGSDAIESMYFNMRQINDLHLSPDAFRKMKNLRLLTFSSNRSWGLNNSMCIVDLELPRNLRYINLEWYPLKSLPLICWENLVHLTMQRSNVEKLWCGVQNLPSMKKIDIIYCTRLIECPNFLGAPNIEVLSFHGCKSLRDVDTSIFSLQKLQLLNFYGCKTLKRLYGNICSPSLRRLTASGCINLQEFSITMLSDQHITELNLGNSGLNKVPPSILHLRNLQYFSFLLCESLSDLPENFANYIDLYVSKHEHDGSVTLRTVLPSSVFRTVRKLSIFNWHEIVPYEVPDNISLLSSLEELSLAYSRVVSLPESIKHLPRLVVLNVQQCIVLRSIPELPLSIQRLDARNCTSLETVLSSKTEPSKTPKSTFLFSNCNKLVEDAYDTILKDAFTRIEYAAKSLSAVTIDHPCSDDDDGLVRSGGICYFLPSRSNMVRVWFHHYSTQASITVELPPISKTLGFVFYFVLSNVQRRHMFKQGCFGWKCYFERSSGERAHVRSFFIKKDNSLFSHLISKTMSDHVLLWYDAQCCKQIMEAFNEREVINNGSTTYNPQLTFEVFAQIKHDEKLHQKKHDEKLVIKECGVRWIYHSEDQIVEEGRHRRSKRSRETYELEATSVQNGVEGSESDEPEVAVPPTKKFRQCGFGMTSNLDTEEVEDLRLLLEQHLCIGEVLK